MILFWGDTIKYKIDISNNRIRLWGLQKGTTKLKVNFGYNDVLACDITVTKNPKLSKNNKTVKSVKVKKGKTVTVRIKNKQKSIKNTYTNSKHAKIISKRSAEVIKIKGKKIGTSYVKVKVNGVKTLKLKVKVTK